MFISDEAKDAVTAADNRASFEQQVRPYLAQLHQAALRMTRNASDAEDLVQETLSNAFVNSYRKTRREPALASGADAPDGWQQGDDAFAPVVRSAEAEALDRLGDSEVLRALRDLPTDFRTAVYLADIEGYHYREVAAMMGTPIGTVMSRLHRGRDRLRRALAAYGPPGRSAPATA